MNPSKCPLHPPIQLGNKIIHIRQSIDTREWTCSRGILYYLCIFSDEIDERFDSFKSILSEELKQDSVRTALLHSATHLELTDSIVFWDCQELIVIRGSSSNFPLYRYKTNAIATTLPCDEDIQVSKAGLAIYMTADLTNGINEPNAILTTPFKDWWRFRRGAMTVLRGDSGILEMPFPVIDLVAERGPDHAFVIKALQDAFASFATSQKNVRCSIMEVSGGFDSTLAGASVRRYQETMYGISAVYPYYEFQHEARLQKIVADVLNIPCKVIDGTQYLPYGNVMRHPWLDEPGKFMTGANFTEAVGAYAKLCNATKIYVGHGGDDLFDADTADLRKTSMQLQHQFFTKPFQKFLTQGIAEMNRPEWRHNNTGLFTYDGRLDTWIKEYFGASIRSPFTDLKVFRAARLWSEYCRSKNAIVDKSILVEALSDHLPIELIQRKGKIRYEGVWARAYYQHGNKIADLIENCASVFEMIGVIPSRLIKRIKDLQNYSTDDETHVIAAYAIADWVHSRNINPKDIMWVQ